MRMPNHRRHYGPLVMLGCLALSPLPAWSQAVAQPSAEDAQIKELVGRLNAITDQAERTRSAKPGVIKSLRDLAASYDRPWHTVILRDDFRDGDFTQAPAWQVAQGDFWVDAQGLRSRAKPAAAAAQQGGDNAAAAALIGSVLKGMTKQGGGQQAAAPAAKLIPAEIFIPAAITNAFALRMELTVLDGAAPFAFGPYLGADRASGYRLLYTPSPQNGRGTLELLRLSGRASAVAGQAAEPVNLEGAAPHVIEWTRTGQGEMVVKIDGKDAMRVTDVSARDAFGGLSISNQGGDYAVRSVAVLGTP